MINDNRMSFLKSDGRFDYYLFSPKLFRQYYNKSENWTQHRKRISHKIHMFLFYIRGGYKILYMMDGNNIATYIVFARSGRTVIDGTSRKDIFTVFVTTHPNYRRQGLATRIVHEMLYDIGLKYDTSYKTIAGSNTESQKVAIANGYKFLCHIKKTKLLHRIQKTDDSDWLMYAFNKRGIV